METHPAMKEERQQTFRETLKTGINFKKKKKRSARRQKWLVRRLACANEDAKWS